MIVKLRFDEHHDNLDKGIVLSSTSIKGSKPDFIRLVVRRDNLADAIEATRNSTTVIAYQYEGMDFDADMEYIKSIATEKPNGKPIMYSIDLSSVPDGQLSVEYLQQYCTKAPSSVRLIFRCTDDFSDMALVYAISHAFKNTAFCGGHLIRLEGCNIGCIRADEDIKTSKPNASWFPKLGTVVIGCGCPMQSIDADDVEITFTETVLGADNQFKKTEKAEKPAKAEKLAKVEAEKPKKSAPKKTTVRKPSFLQVGSNDF